MSLTKLLPVFILLSLLVGCSQNKEADPPVPKTGVELIAIGPTNFGGVIVGNYRDAAIKVYNYGPGSVDTSNINNALTGHFHIQSVSNPCATGVLPSGSNCVVSIRFKPTISGQFYQDFIVGDTALRVTGRGQVNGNIEISDSLWDTGQTVAGQEIMKNIFVSNQGDFPVQSPTISSIAGLTVGFNNCGIFIQPQSSCRMELVLRKTVAGNLSELVTFQVPDSYSPQLTLVTDVIATESAGTIEFNNPPSSVIADGMSEIGISTLPIRDQFGNVVLDNTPVHFSAANCTIITDPNPRTISGVVSVIVRASQTKGNCTLNSISASANGILHLRQTAGPPYGTIQVEAYAQEVVANGQTQIVFKTLTIKDQYNNIVENGTEINYSLIGGGSLDQPTGSTVLGKSLVVLTSPANPGTTQLVIRAGPIRDSTGAIIGYSANGVYQVRFTAGPPVGNIPITSQYSGIYAIEESSYEELGYNIHSIITVGPLRDSSGNVVSANTAVNIRVTNGVNVTLNGNNVTGYTNGDGSVNFLLAGAGNRGDIIIEASTLSGASGMGTVWAFKQESLNPTAIGNKVELFEIIKQGGAIPARSDSWVSVSENYIGTTSGHDANFYKMEKVAYATPGIFATLPFFLEECLVTYNSFVMATPCRVSNSTIWNGGSLIEKNLWPQRGSDYDPRQWNTKGNDFKTFNALQPIEMIPQNRYSNTQFSNITVSTYDVSCSPVGTYQQPTVFRNPGIGMIESIDKILIFGGFFHQRVGGSTPGCSQHQFPSGEAMKISSIYTGLAESTALNNNSFLTRQNGNEDPDVIGDYPPSHGNMRLVSKGGKMFGFGGFLPIPGGSAYNQLYVFTGSGVSANKWAVLRPDNDPIEADTGGEPEARYQNGLVYVPELNNLYVIGGLKEYFCGNYKTSGTCLSGHAGVCQWEQNSCLPVIGGDGRGWETARDIWELNLDAVDNPGNSEIPFQWKRLCGSEVLVKPAELGGGANPASISCGLDVGNPHDNLAAEPEGGGAYNRVVTNIQAVYNKIRGKVYFYWQEKNLVREFSPFLKVFPAVTPTDGAQNLQGAFQVLYNNISERMIGYFRDNTQNGHTGATSSLRVFDVIPGDKYYFKTIVDIGAGARVNAKSLIIKVSGKGSIAIPPATGSDGLEMRLFNFNTSSWELVGSHNQGTSDTSVNPADIISFVVPPANIPNYISTQGKIEIMFNPKGSMLNNSEMKVWVNQIGIEGIF